VERRVSLLPAFERRHVDLDVEWLEVEARPLGELCAELDADDGVAALEERAGRLAGRAADLEQAVAGLEIGQRLEVVEQGRRIGRPGRVVEVRDRVERAPQHLARRAHATGSSSAMATPPTSREA